MVRPPTSPRPAAREPIGDDPQHERRQLVRFLALGGAVVREEIGGVVGVRACSAARTGREFAPSALDELIAEGCVVRRTRYACRPLAERPDHFMLFEVAGDAHG